MFKHCQGIDDGDGALRAAEPVFQISGSKGRKEKSRGSFCRWLPHALQGWDALWSLALMGPEPCFPPILFFPILQGGYAQGRVMGLDGSDTTEQMPGFPHQEDSPKASRVVAIKSCGSTFSSILSLSLHPNCLLVSTML